LVETSAYPAVLDPIVGVETELEQPIEISSFDVSSFAVASNGHEYLVTWSGSGSGVIYAARVDASGTVRARTRVAAASATGTPRAVWAGTQWFVAWCQAGQGIVTVRVARLATDGSPKGDPVNFGSYYTSSAIAYDNALGLASDGTNALVVWSREDSSLNRSNHVYGALLGPNGAPINSSDIVISSAAIHQMAPSVVYDGIQYVVAGADARASTSFWQPSWDIYGARVSTSGVVIDTSGIAISTAAGDQKSPMIASSGANVLVAWNDTRGTKPAIYGARLASAS